MTAWTTTRIALPEDQGFDRWTLDSGVPGLRVVIFGGTHGDEIEGIMAANRLAGMDLGLKSGIVEVVPVVNESAYRADTRTSAIDGLNLARVFPGKVDGKPTERLAYALRQQVLIGADLLIDLHTSGRTLEIPYVTGYIDDGRDTKGLAERAAKVFGADFIWRHAERAQGRTISDMDAAIYTECVGGGPADKAQAQLYVDGVLRVLNEIGMLTAPLAAPATKPPLRIISGGDVDNDLIPATRDGLFVRDVLPGEKVAKGQRLGVVTDTRGTILEEIRAPFDGWIIVLKCRPHVKAGDQLVGVAIADDRRV